VAQNNYFIGLEAAGKIGAGKALGFYSNVKKIGQMLGPIVFGSLAFLGPGEFGLVGCLFFLCLLLFWFTRQKESRYLPAAAEGKDTQA